jgi:hypothetical protein
MNYRIAINRPGGFPYLNTCFKNNFLNGKRQTRKECEDFLTQGNPLKIGRIWCDIR